MSKQVKTKNTAIDIIVSTKPTPSTQPNVAAKKKKRRRNRKKRSQSGLQFSPAQSFVDTLNDPFEHGPVKLGYGSLAPSALGTVYARSFFQSASDGSFSLALLPMLNPASASGVKPILFNLATSNTIGGWTSADWTNNSGYLGAASEIRVVSYGIKVMPMIAATGSPGMIFAGSFSGMSWNLITAQSTTNLSSDAMLKVGYGNCGATASGRPTDTTSFQFRTDMAQQISGDAIPTWTVPVICGIGLPASTTVFYEFVMNFEYLYAAVDPQVVDSPDAVRDRDLSSYFPTIENMWQSVKTSVTDDGIIGAINAFTRGSTAAANRAISFSRGPTRRRLYTPVTSESKDDTDDDPNDSASSSSASTTDAPPITHLTTHVSTLQTPVRSTVHGKSKIAHDK